MFLQEENDLSGTTPPGAMFVEGTGSSFVSGPIPPHAPAGFTPSAGL